MGGINAITGRTVYYAPTRGRSYVTKRGAVYAEASAMMSKKYNEAFEIDTGAGFMWKADEGLCRVFERLARRIMNTTKEPRP